MAGLSKRFNNAGFTLPKYMLYAREKSLFNLAVSSFQKYFKTANFLFIARDVFSTAEFIHKECLLLGVVNYEIVILNKPTRGQAETVYLGICNLKLAETESVLIFNIDTFRPSFSFPDELSCWDGYLEVFEGTGNNWSYAKTENFSSKRVIQTAEKKQISNYCSTGIYYFKEIGSFVDAFENTNVSKLELPEMYIAPLYNYLITQGQNISIDIIKRTDVVFCGVPEEYYSFLDNLVMGKKLVVNY
jgi:hypothetical protein